MRDVEKVQMITIIENQLVKLVCEHTTVCIT